MQPFRLWPALAFIALSWSAPALAQKSINFEFTGSVSSTLTSTVPGQTDPDLYWFDARAGEQFILYTSLIAFDTTLRVVAPNTEYTFFNDDEGPSVLSSRIELTAPVGGRYVVFVSSYVGRPDAGNYALNFERLPAVARSGGEPDPLEDYPPKPAP